VLKNIRILGSYWGRKNKVSYGAKILLKLNQVNLAKTDLIWAIQLNAENEEASTLLKFNEIK